MRTTYDTQTGAYTYTDDNVDGNWQTAVKLGVNGALDSKRRLRYAVGAATRYVHSVDFAVAYDTPSDDLSRVNTVRTGLDMSLTYTLGKLTAALPASMPRTTAAATAPVSSPSTRSTISTGQA